MDYGVNVTIIKRSDAFSSNVDKSGRRDQPAVVPSVEGDVGASGRTPEVTLPPCSLPTSSLQKIHRPTYSRVHQENGRPKIMISDHCYAEGHRNDIPANDSHSALLHIEDMESERRSRVDAPETRLISNGLPAVILRSVS